LRDYFYYYKGHYYGDYRDVYQNGVGTQTKRYPEHCLIPKKVHIDFAYI
jgi:hypothetical protein